MIWVKTFPLKRQLCSENGDEWKFNAIGNGFQGGLAALCENYGVDVE